MTLTSRPDVSERILTQRELNRALLARQLLLGRRRLSIPQAVEEMGTTQTQYAPSAYLGLWTRLDGFEREALTRALERRTVVQGTMMRNTIHVASPRDYWPLVLAIRPFSWRQLPATAPSRRKVLNECGVLVLKIRGRYSSGRIPVRHA